MGQHLWLTSDKQRSMLPCQSSTYYISCKFTCCESNKWTMNDQWIARSSVTYDLDKCLPFLKDECTCKFRLVADRDGPKTNPQSNTKDLYVTQKHEMNQNSLDKTCPVLFSPNFLKKVSNISYFNLKEMQSTDTDKRVYQLLMMFLLFKEFYSFMLLQNWCFRLHTVALIAPSSPPSLQNFQLTG